MNNRILLDERKIAPHREIKNQLSLQVYLNRTTMSKEFDIQGKIHMQQNFNEDLEYS